jgi:hypothetical protein
MGVRTSCEAIDLRYRAISKGRVENKNLISSDGKSEGISKGQAENEK